MDKFSPQEQVERHLRCGRSITPLFALHNFGCFRLSSIIHRLRKKGLDIETNIHPEGGYAIYLLKKGDIDAI